MGFIQLYNDATTKASLALVRNGERVVALLTQLNGGSWNDTVRHVPYADGIAPGGISHDFDDGARMWWSICLSLHPQTACQDYFGGGAGAGAGFSGASTSSTTSTEAEAVQPIGVAGPCPVKGDVP